MAISDDDGKTWYASKPLIGFGNIQPAVLRRDDGVLVAYMREDGYYLELEQLQRGLMWGVGRLAAERPALLYEKNCATYLQPYLKSKDSTVRGLAAWALGVLRSKEAVTGLEKITNDQNEVRLYFNRSMTTDTVGGLAHKALANIAKES
jgi:hypothetical protein